MAEAGEQDGPRDLAAEYALGVLDAAGRIEAQRRIASDPDFAAQVSAWEERLSPMAEAYGEAAPPPRVRDAVEARLFGAPQPASGVAGFWRVLALASLVALAVSLGAHALRIAERPAGATLVVSLDPADPAASAPVRFLAVFEPDANRVRLRPVSGEAQAGSDFELWLIEGGNAPVSLGLLGRGEAAAIELSPELAARMREDATLAVSVEPAGGSPTGQPTGPVVAAGAARRI